MIQIKCKFIDKKKNNKKIPNGIWVSTNIVMHFVWKRYTAFLTLRHVAAFLQSSHDLIEIFFCIFLWIRNGHWWNVSETVSLSLHSWVLCNISRSNMSHVCMSTYVIWARRLTVSLHTITYTQSHMYFWMNEWMNEWVH